MNNSSSSDSSSMYDSSYFTQEVHITIILLYIFATLVNFGANSLIWIVVLKNNFLRSPMNYLLLNLSLADMVAGLSVYPYLFILDVGIIFTSPKQQARLCIVTEGLSFFFVAAGASLLTLCAISGNRFLSACYPTRQNLRMGRTSVFLFSIFSWIISTSCMFPGMLSFKYEPEFKSCIRDWGPINGFVYRSAILLIGTVFPSIFLVTSFFAIVVKSRQIARMDNARMTGGRILQLRRAEKTLGVLIVVYIVCWLPFSAFWGLMNANHFPRTVQGVEKGNRWMRISVFFATLNGTCDPFVYTLGSSDLTKAAKQVLIHFWRKLSCNGDARSSSLRVSQRRVHPTICVEIDEMANAAPLKIQTLGIGGP